jgi:hypothetical protein
MLSPHEEWLIANRLKAQEMAPKMTDQDKARLHKAIAKVAYMKDAQAARAALGAHSMTAGDAVYLLVVQNSYCACCPQDLSSDEVNRWGVDHNRQKHRVRGILCFSCNTGIRPVWQVKCMVEYLKRNGDWDE